MDRAIALTLWAAREALGLPEQRGNDQRPCHEENIEHDEIHQESLPEPGSGLFR